MNIIITSLIIYLSLLLSLPPSLPLSLSPLSLPIPFSLLRNCSLSSDEREQVGLVINLVSVDAANNKA